MKRSHAYQHIPLTEVQIYKGTGQEEAAPGPAYTVEQMQAELKKDAMMADKYGQWIYETWDGKVTSDEQLRQEYAAEAGALAKVKRDPEQVRPVRREQEAREYESTVISGCSKSTENGGLLHRTDTNFF